MARTKEMVMSQIGEVKQAMEQKKEQLAQETQGEGEKMQQLVQNHNQVRIAAQTLSQMKSMIGERGEEISAIAKEFDNSVQAVMTAEEKIQSKSGFARFFTGGDEKAADEIEAQVAMNQQKIQELKQLSQEADAPDEVKQMLQEQVQIMENEQARLQELAQKEKQSKGLLGWIWK